MAASATTVHHWTNLLHLDDQDWRSGSRKDSRKPIGIVSWTSPLSSWRDFENPLDELVKRHPGIEISFRRIDAHQFTAVAYRDGKAQARCRIFMGAFIGGIAYSANDRGSGDSYNENISAETDEQSLLLRPLGMSMHMSSSREARWTMAGAAEYYWSLFIEPLQR